MRLLLILGAVAAAALLAMTPRSAFGAEDAFTRTIVVSGLSSPVDVVAPRSEPNRLYIVEQRGTIRVLDKGKLRRSFFLDVRKVVAFGGEQGLLGLAFDPKYTTNHFIYVDYTDTNGNTRVVRYKTNGTRAIPSTALVILRIDQPYANHNGGDLVFGPDGGLYVGMGDGGSGGDPENRAQNMQQLLGKMLRLDVRKPGSAPTIVALGLRNPWRYSFDRQTGDLYIGDVGQGDVEEVDFTPKSEKGLLNYGWDVYEGSHTFEDKPPGPGKLVFPVYEYTHANGGCTVVGGYVYRGSARSAELGRYIFGDFCTGVVTSLKIAGGKATAVRVEPFTIPNLSSFGENARGELYATSLDGVLYRLS